MPRSCGDEGTTLAIGTGMRALPVITSISRSLLLPLALAGAAIGCSDGPLPEDFETSREVWEQARDDGDDSYTYVRYEEYWSGERYETTITVDSGEITHRSWTYSTDEGGILDAWDEVGAAEIDTHEEGFAAVTLDALYDLCASDVLPHDEEHIDVTFATFPDGLLKDCYFVDQSVQDGGAEGVQLMAIELDVQSCGLTGGLAGKPCG
jgi:hypothetical protein